MFRTYYFSGNPWLTHQFTLLAKEGHGIYSKNTRTTTKKLKQTIANFNSIFVNFPPLNFYTLSCSFSNTASQKSCSRFLNHSPFICFFIIPYKFLPMVLPVKGLVKNLAQLSSPLSYLPQSPLPHATHQKRVSFMLCIPSLTCLSIISLTVVYDRFMVQR